MWRKSSSIALIIGLAGSLGSCSGGGSSGPAFVVTNDPWRKPAESQCLQSGAVRETPYIQAISERLNDNENCQPIQPFKVTATAGGSVGLKPVSILQCGMILSLDRFVRDVVEPAALQAFGTPIVELQILSSYSCRPMDSIRGARLSEHGRANAIDIGGFKLATGEMVTVLHGWRAGGAESTFLRNVHRGACRYFGTVLGPESDSYHQNHFHLDLMQRRSGHYCH